MGAYLTVFKLLTENKIGDRPLLQLAALLMVLGVQFVSTGIVADMIMRTYHESQHKPIYYVRERRWSQRDSSDTRPEATEAMMTG
ncbi:MAG: hypothetical protein F4Z94_07880 [Chloroflexi bacterium]|nr:hypothetical protein [Chloroflexota bacterium]